jgi:Domain of unknown function (DUF4383)
MRRTIAQHYCLAFGAILVVVAAVGFAVNSSFAMGDHVMGSRLLGLFEVNGWHNVVHLVSGVAALWFSRQAAGARSFAFAIGAVYGVVTILGIAYGDGNGMLGMIAMNTADNFLHLGIGAAGIMAGILSTEDDALAAPGTL